MPSSPRPRPGSGWSQGSRAVPPCPRSKRPPQHLEDGLQPNLAARCYCLGIPSGELRAEAVRIGVPEWVGDDLDKIPAATGLQDPIREALPAGLRREVGPGGG